MAAVQLGIEDRAICWPLTVGNGQARVGDEELVTEGGAQSNVCWLLLFA
jgi:hypothetical protein